MYIFPCLISLIFQILYERGRLSQKTQKLVTMSVPANLREALVPEKEFWTASKTLTFLADGTYFKDEEGGSLQWPKEIENMLDESKFSFIAFLSDSKLACLI